MDSKLFSAGLRSFHFTSYRNSRSFSLALSLPSSANPSISPRTHLQRKIIWTKTSIPAVHSPGCLGSINLREPQHTPGAYPMNPQTPKWKKFRTINYWLGVWGMFQGYVGKFLETKVRSCADKQLWSQYLNWKQSWQNHHWSNRGHYMTPTQIACTIFRGNPPNIPNLPYICIVWSPQNG